jgi:hypothetical protein
MTRDGQEQRDSVTQQGNAGRPMAPGLKVGQEILQRIGCGQPIEKLTSL